MPEDHFGTRLRIEGRDPESVALELALFALQTGAVEALLEELKRQGDHPAGQITLRLLADGSMSIDWVGSHTLEARSRTLPLPSP